MYKVIGYIYRDRKSDFHFAVTVYQKENNIYRAYNDPITGKITSFRLIDTNPGNIVPHEDDKTYSEESDYLYIFVFKGSATSGNKTTVTINLFKLIKYNILNPLELYDIYFFIGDVIKAENAINDFLCDWQPDILNKNNFLLPAITALNTASFSICIEQISKLTEAYPDAIDYTTFFRQDEKNIYFLNYSINVSQLEGCFESLARQSSSVFYKDLIVHCYLQDGLTSQEILQSREFKLRKLIPFINVSNIHHHVMDVLIRNSQSHRQVVYNVGERNHQIDKTIFGDDLGIELEGKSSLKDEILTNLVNEIKYECEW